MVAFGGSGPAHAARIARKLRIPKVIYPVGTGVMSAIGMLVSPLSFQLARTHRVYLKEIEPVAFTAFFSQIEADARAILFGSQDPVGGIVTVRRYLDMRYEGQGYEIEVELPQDAEPSDLLVAARAAFDNAYRKIFALGQLDEAVEILNWKVEVVGATPKAPSGQQAGEPEAPSPRAFRSAFFPESGFIECPVFDRYAIGRGHMIEGPAFIEERESTCVLGAGDRASLDNLGNLVAEIGALAQ
jgi:N-methylhydantoinase A